MRIVDRCRHQHVGFIGGIAEHQTLIAGSLLVVLRLIDAHGDIGRLPADGIHHGTGVAVESALRVVVTNLVHHLAHQAFHVHIGFGGDLARHHHHAGFDQRFAGDT